MVNQNIYSDFYNGYIVVNRKVISELGLNSKPFLRTIYIVLLERADWNTGIVFMSFRFFAATFNVSKHNKYRELIDELKQMGLLEEIETVKGQASRFKIVHYKEATDTKVEKK